MFEGYVRQMYLDDRGLVSTGVGYLIDSVDDAARLQWVRIAADGRSDGPSASRKEVEEEWKRVKTQQQWKGIGGGNFIAKARATQPPIITLQMAATEVDRTFMAMLNGLERTMKETPGGFFQDYENFPADAQLGILSHLWANGANNLHKRWPNFCRLCKERKWREIIETKHYRWKNIRKDRDQAMIRVFTNAANLEDANAKGFSFDAALVYYPQLILPLQEIEV